MWPLMASENPKMASGGQTKAQTKKVHKTKVIQNLISPLKTPLKIDFWASGANFRIGSQFGLREQKMASRGQTKAQIKKFHKTKVV